MPGTRPCSCDLSTEIWQMVAKCTVKVHRLRTVFHVVQDLVALQLICKAAAPCTLGLWQLVASLCSKKSRCGVDDIEQLTTLLSDLGFVPKHERVQQALSLSADKLAVYMQLHSERYTSMPPKVAASKFMLTEEDLQQVLSLPIHRVPSILGPLHYDQAIILHATLKWGGIAGLEDHEYKLLLGRSEEACAKNAKRVEMRQQLELSDEGQKKLALEAKQTEETAALFPGGLARRAQMIAALSVHGLRLRADIKLCESYICRCQGRPADIANTMRDMQWLFDNTDYYMRTLKAYRKLRTKQKRQQLMNADPIGWEEKVLKAQEIAKVSAMQAWCKLNITKHPLHTLQHSLLPVAPASLMQLVPPGLQQGS